MTAKTFFSTRKARLEDVNAIASLVAGVGPWRDDPSVVTMVAIEVADMFSNATFRPTFFVAEVGGVVVGVSCWNFSWASFDTFEFTWMCVRPEFQGRGIGEALHRARLEDLALYRRPGKAMTILLSTELVGRYERFGFRVINEEPNLMIRVVPASP